MEFLQIFSISHGAVKGECFVERLTFRKVIYGHPGIWAPTRIGSSSTWLGGLVGICDTFLRSPLQLREGSLPHRRLTDERCCCALVADIVGMRVILAPSLSTTSALAMIKVPAHASCEAGRIMMEWVIFTLSVFA